MAWTDLSAVASGTPPSARNGHGITSAGGKLYVHGGRGGSSSGGGACLGGGALPGGTVACRPVSRQGRVGILHLGQVCIGSAQNDRRFPNSLDACCWFVWVLNDLRLIGLSCYLGSRSCIHHRIMLYYIYITSGYFILITMIVRVTKERFLCIVLEEALDS